MHTLVFSGILYSNLKGYKKITSPQIGVHCLVFIKFLHSSISLHLLHNYSIISQLLWQLSGYY